MEFPQGHWLGQIDYTTALDWQMEVHRQVQAQPWHGGMIAGLEHPHTITIGRRGNQAIDLKVDGESLRQQGVAIHQSERGGHATLHSPGQLVIYPVLPLTRWGLGVRAYVRLLQKTTLRWLGDLGVEAFCRGPEPGLYTAKGKIAFFGLRIRSGISLHGLSVNVANDLEKFSHIRSCGRAEETFDRLRFYFDVDSLDRLFLQWNQVFLEELSSIARAERSPACT